MDIGGIFGMQGKKQGFETNFPPPMQDAMQQALPTANVLNMRGQGMKNNQIVQSLNQQGFAPDQINDAMNIADVKGAVDGWAQGAPIQGMPMQQPEQEPMPPPPQFSPEFTSPNERIEELAEAIIDEKWKELSKNIDKIISWKDKTEAKLQQLEQESDELKKNFESLHSAILGKVSEYDQNIISLGSEIKAMEKVFQKLLPTFTENVSELSRLTKDIAKKKNS